MSKFDIRYNQILKEAGGFMGALGKVASGVNNATSAIGSGINAAQQPFQGTKNLIQGLAGYNKKSEDRLKEPISAKNPVNKNEIVQCNTSIYYQGDKLDKDGKTIPMRDKTGNLLIDRTTKRPMLEKGWVTEEVSVEGTTLDKSDNQGNFTVKLNDPDTVFIQYPYNQNGVVKNIIVIGKKSKLPPNVTIIGKDGSMLKVGQNVAGIVTELKNWYIKAK